VLHVAVHEFTLVLPFRVCQRAEFSSSLPVNIRTVDEAVVFGAALSLSSSTFVLEDCDSFALVHALCCGPVPTHVLKSFLERKSLGCNMSDTVDVCSF
jgi:hypothetical protein